MHNITAVSCVRDENFFVRSEKRKKKKNEKFDPCMHVSCAKKFSLILLSCLITSTEMYDMKSF